MSDLEKELEAWLNPEAWSEDRAIEAVILIGRALDALRERHEDTRLLDWLDARDGWINGSDCYVMVHMPSRALAKNKEGLRAMVREAISNAMKETDK